MSSDLLQQLNNPTKKRRRGRPPKDPIVTNKLDLLINSFGLSVKPEQKLSIIDWASKHVKLQRSSRSDYADLLQTPWIVKPLEAILSNDFSEVVLCAPTGSGKSTMFEIAATYIVAEKPGPTLFACQTDADASEWMATGLLPALQNCRRIDALWSSKRNQIKKDFIQLSHMPIYCGGSNISNFQSKSVDNVFIDEAWMLKQGLLQEARRRTHDRFGSKVILVSQAGIGGDDFDLALRQCYTHEYSFHCPECDTWHPYDFENLKWDCNKKDENVIWESIVAWYECPQCQHRFEDNVQERRSMAETGDYIPTASDNPLRGHIAYHYTALCVWWVEWRSLVIEFLKANQARKHGNFNFLKQFLQKRLAKPWDELGLEDNEAISIGEYSLEDKVQWDVTILTVDVQKQDLWYLVRTWSKSGESRLLEASKVVTFNDIEKIRERWNIKSTQVFMDTAYRTEEVKSVVAKYKYLGLNGRAESSYAITDKRTGRKYKRLYSMPINHQSPNGQATFTYYSSNSVKDVLFILKAGHGTRWEVAKDATQEYMQQISSEVKVLGENNVPVYKKIRRDNHFLDLEAMQIVAAQMWYVFPQVYNKEEE